MIENLYHEINWDSIRTDIETFANVYPKDQYNTIIQTYNYLKDKIEKYKILN